jgi:hypothetical protein
VQIRGLKCHTVRQVRCCGFCRNARPQTRLHCAARFAGSDVQLHHAVLQHHQVSRKFWRHFHRE